jgi:uncharacterized membrane protein
VGTFKDTKLPVVMKYILKLVKEKKEVNFESLNELCKFPEFDLFVFISSMYHDKFIEVSDHDFYKNPIDRMEFSIIIAPAGYNYLLELGIT